jgi:hypothetical protein
MKFRRLNNNKSRTQVAHSESVLRPHVQSLIATKFVLSLGPTQRHVEWTGGEGVDCFIIGKILNNLVFKDSTLLSRGMNFEYNPVQQLHLLAFARFSSVSPTKCRNMNFIIPQPFSSKSSPVYYSPVILPSKFHVL